MHEPAASQEGMSGHRRPGAPPAPEATPEQALALRQAFEFFNRASAELTQAYEALQGRVESLTAELAVANGELRRQYREKEALSERLAALLSALPVGVVVVDGDGRIGEANPAAAAMFARPLAGLGWREEVEPLLAPEAGSDEWLLTRPGMALRVTRAEAQATDGGRIIVLHDVTSAHDLKTRFERNQRLAAMGELAASLAHQLRTPLATALLYCGNLAKPELPSETRLRFAGRVGEQLRRLERLIQDVLLFARGETIGREAIPLGELIAEAAQAVEALRAARGVHLQLAAVDGDTVLVGARKPLAGALVSLLENALQASADGAAVRVEGTAADGRVAITVSDQGAGIAPEHLGRIFEPFFTTRGQGTGLGLAIALGVARAHGGTLEVASEAGRGSRFTLSLPVGEALVRDVQ
jgi:two-component system sensor histidine kinase FlrB